MVTQVEIGQHLDMSERAVRDMLNQLEIDHRQASLDDIRVAYIRDMRAKAAGRGGDEQASLTAARTRQATADAQQKELQYYRELQHLVPVEELEPIIANWAATARSEVTFAVEKIVASIESQHGIEVDKQSIDDSLQPALRTIGSYPAGHGPDAEQGGGGVGAADAAADEGVAG